MDNKEFILTQINQQVQPTLMQTLGIKFTNLGEDYLEATMEVTPELHQPMGLLHGGASVALAESVGSCLSNILLDQSRFYAVGIQINSNHLKSIKEGVVTARAKILKKGQSVHFLEIEMRNNQQELLCYTTMSNMVLTKK